TNKQFHPKANGWVGYIFTVKGQRIYIAGDTDYIPEMKSFKADIVLLPVSGTYVMTADEAIKAALDIKPKTAIPMHYGSIIGSKDDAKRFADGLKGKIEVVILNEE
ncbi:MAG: MBL fold metallo-hydrolase, partial [Nitrospirota bacterium]